MGLGKVKKLRCSCTQMCHHLKKLWNRKMKLEWHCRKVSGIREDEMIKMEFFFEVHGSGPLRTREGAMNYVMQ